MEVTPRKGVDDGEENEVLTFQSFFLMEATSRQSCRPSMIRNDGNLFWIKVAGMVHRIRATNRTYQETILIDIS